MGVILYKIKTYYYFYFNHFLLVFRTDDVNVFTDDVIVFTKYSVLGMYTCLRLIRCKYAM